MNRLFLAVTSLCAIATTASAADLPLKAPPMPVATVYNWTGCYAGIVGGGEWGRSRSISNGTNNGVDNGTAGFLKTETNLSGGTAGGTLGCNYQTGRWVFGIEGDGAWTGRRGNSNLVTPFIPAFQEDVSSSWLATVRGRIGYTVGANGSVLLYGTAGGAFTDLRIHEFNPTGVGNSLIGATETNTFSGWTAGAGVEWGFAPNWSAKLEYLYVDFGSKGFFQNTVTGCCTFQSAHLTDNLVRVGVNYHLNWARPVVAKY